MKVPDCRSADELRRELKDAAAAVTAASLEAFKAGQALKLAEARLAVLVERVQLGGE